jgi:hypothetical protein
MLILQHILHCFLADYNYKRERGGENLYLSNVALNTWGPIQK